MVKRSFKDLTPLEKQARYDYAKERRHNLSEQMRKAGIIGQPRPKLTEEERMVHRREYNKNYRQRIKAESDAYREIMKLEGRQP